MNTVNLSSDARALVRQAFGRGLKSRLSTAVDPLTTKVFEGALKELVKAGVVTSRRKPRQPEHILYRGTLQSAVLFQEMVRSEVPNAGSAPPVDPHLDQIEYVLVADPHLTDAEFYHQRQRSSDPYVGLAAAAMNQRGRLGGFAAFKNRTTAQDEAAARFRRMFDRAHRGGVQAIDYRNNKVDSSPFMANAYAGQTGILDAADDYKRAVRHLGLIRSSLVERIVVHDIPMRQIATGARQRNRVAAELRAALDDLADHFGLVQKMAG